MPKYTNPVTPNAWVTDVPTPKPGRKGYWNARLALVLDRPNEYARFDVPIRRLPSHATAARRAAAAHPRDFVIKARANDDGKTGSVYVKAGQ